MLETCWTIVGWAGLRISAPRAATKPTMAARLLRVSENSVKPWGMVLFTFLLLMGRTMVGVLAAERAGAAKDGLETKVFVVAATEARGRTAAVAANAVDILE